MIDLPALLAAAAQLWSVTIDDLRRAPRGNDRIIAARQALSLVLSEHEYTTIEIGVMLGKDRSTITNAVQRARRRLDSDATFAARYRALAASIDRTPPRTVGETVTRRRDAWTIDNSVHIALFFWGIPEPVTA